MKFVINCEPDNLDAAMKLAAQEAAVFTKYTRVGWGWTFGRAPRFFVRRLKDGLSIRENPPV